MLSLSKTGSEERTSRVLYAENRFEPMEEDVMVDMYEVAGTVANLEKLIEVSHL